MNRQAWQAAQCLAQRPPSGLSSGASVAGGATPPIWFIERS